MIDIMLCRERRETSLTVLLVNCHDFTGRIFDPSISRQTGMKSPLKWNNQAGKKSTGLLESLHVILFVCFSALECCYLHKDGPALKDLTKVQTII